MENSNSMEMDEIVTTGLINEWINENIDDFVKPIRQIKPRIGTISIDYSKTNWGRWLNDPSIVDYSSKIAKVFN
jgi:hypothetical protein